MLHPKVRVSGTAGALAVVLVYVAGLFGADVPAEVAAALTVLISTGAGYMRSSHRLNEVPPEEPAG